MSGKSAVSIAAYPDCRDCMGRGEVECECWWVSRACHSPDCDACKGSGRRPCVRCQERGEPTPREIRRSEKAAACADRLLAEATRDGAVPNVGAMIEAAYVAGWNESIDDVKQMIEASSRDAELACH